MRIILASRLVIFFFKSCLVSSLSFKSFEIKSLKFLTSWSLSLTTLIRSVLSPSTSLIFSKRLFVVSSNTWLKSFSLFSVFLSVSTIKPLYFGISSSLSLAKFSSRILKSSNIPSRLCSLIPRSVSVSSWYLLSTNSPTSSRVLLTFSSSLMNFLSVRSSLSTTNFLYFGSSSSTKVLTV